MIRNYKMYHLCMLLACSSYSCASDFSVLDINTLPVAGGAAVGCLAFPHIKRGEIGYSVGAAVCAKEAGLAAAIALAINEHVKVFLGVGAGWKIEEGASSHLFCFGVMV